MTHLLTHVSFLGGSFWTPFLTPRSKSQFFEGGFDVVLGDSSTFSPNSLKTHVREWCRRGREWCRPGREWCRPGREWCRPGQAKLLISREPREALYEVKCKILQSEINKKKVKQKLGSIPPLCAEATPRWVPRQWGVLLVGSPGFV